MNDSMPPIVDGTNDNGFTSSDSDSTLPPLGKIPEGTEVSGKATATVAPVLSDSKDSEFGKIDTDHINKETGVSGNDWSSYDSKNDQYVFDLGDCTAFVVKQSTGAVIWYDNSIYSEADQELLKKYFIANDDSLKPKKNGNAREIHIEFTTLNDFNMNDWKNCFAGGQFDTHVQIIDGKVYVKKSDKLSHFGMGLVAKSGEGTASKVFEGETSNVGMDVGVKFDGVLKYTYKKEDHTVITPIITVEGESSTIRDINVSLGSSTSTTEPGDSVDVDTDTETTPPTPPTDGDTDLPDDPTPLADTPDETAAPELTDIEDVPAPLQDAPEETTIEDEDVPLAELPDEEVPLAELPDDPVPLADVPTTGDSTLPLFAGLAACLSALGLSFGKRRRED